MVCHGRGKVSLQHTTKKTTLHSSDISGYHADFHEGHDTVGAGQGLDMAGARYGLFELTHGRAGERHGHGMWTAWYMWIGLFCFDSGFSPHKSQAFWPSPVCSTPEFLIRFNCTREGNFAKFSKVSRVWKFENPIFSICEGQSQPHGFPWNPNPC